jgi:hypothetical protein
VEVTMATVPVDGRKQCPKLMVELTNVMNGREPTFGVHQQVGDRYILEKYPPAVRTSGPSWSSGPPPDSTPETPKTPTAGQRLWPNLP